MAATVGSPEVGSRRRVMLSAGSAMTFVILIGTVSLFSDATYEGGRSLTGQYLRLLGSSALAVGIAAGAGEFLGYALRLVTGFAADRTGAYWLITFIGYGINLVALPSLAFVGRWDVAIGVMFAERIGKAIRNPARDAMLSYATKEMGRGWGYGLHEAMDQTGALIGPLVMAGILALHSGGRYTIGDYQGAFKVLYIPAVCAVGLLITARFLFPKPKDLESKTPKVSAQGWENRFWLYVVAAGLIGAGFADFALIAYHLKATNLAPDQLIPVLFAVAMGVQAVAALIAGRLYDRSSGMGTVVLSFGLGSLFAPFVFLGSLQLVIAGLVLWGIGMAAQEGILKAALADLIPADRRAYGFGLFACAFGVFWFAGSALMGFLYDRNVTLLVIFSVAVQIAALPLFWLARRGPTRRNSS